MKVINAAGKQVGHIPRAVASKLADFMDQSLITVEGMMIGQNVDMAHHFQLGINVNLYGKQSLRDTLEPLLRSAFGNALARPQAPNTLPTGTQPTVGPSDGATRRAAVIAAATAADETKRQLRLSRIMEGLTEVSENNQYASSVMVCFVLTSADQQDSLTKDMDLTSLPAHSSPPGIARGNLHVDLLHHQSQALQVCC
jgi:SWI/SNF-related matrix-associated actin-dependent regulator of chromatin subfamily A3